MWIASDCIVKPHTLCAPLGILTTIPPWWPAVYASTLVTRHVYLSFPTVRIWISELRAHMCIHPQHIYSGLATDYGPNSARGREQASPHHSATLLAHTRQLLHDTMTLEACSSAPGWRTTECEPSSTSKRPHASNHTEPQHTNAGETTLPTSDTATSRRDAQRRRRNHTNLRHLNCLIAGETTQRRHTALTDIPCCTHANGPPSQPPATQQLRGRRQLLQLLWPTSPQPPTPHQLRGRRSDYTSR
jgi:hypothetical protein